MIHRFAPPAGTAALIASLAVAACSSTTGPDSPPVEGTAYHELANQRRGSTDISFLAGATEPDGTTWFGGSLGVMLTRRGTSPWEVVLLPTNDLVTGLWSGGGELLAVAGGELFSRSGNDWNTVPLPPSSSQYLELWGTDSEHLWIGGTAGTILFRDRGNWLRANVPVANEIWGIAAEGSDDVVAVGQSGVILESVDGVTFETVSSPTNQTLFSVASDGTGRFVAVGASGTVLLREGDTWEVVPIATTQNLFAVESDGPGSFLVVGDGGTMFTGDGVSWQAIQVGGGGENLRAITGARGQRTAAGWTGSIIDEAIGWKSSESGTRIYSVHDPVNGNPIAVGRGGIAFERIGGEWTELTTPTTKILLGIDGPSAEDRLVVGDSGTVFHLLNGEWYAESVPTELTVRSVFYDGFRALAVGEGGVAMVRENGVWRQVATGTDRYLRHVWGRSFSRLWVVGDSGTMLRWNGDSFVSVNTPVQHNLRGGYSFGSNDVWAVGDVGSLLHLEGGIWVKKFPPVLNNIRAIHAVENVLYLVGEQGLAYSRVDGVWKPMLTDNPGLWLGVDGRDELIVVGETGAIAEGVR